ncbi:MAG TPA: flagellar basal body protein [Acidimicrobiales bacterium]|nr:flagellar basal body protein [Acidimicrobiales bacterium]
MADAVQAISILNFALDSIQDRSQVIANNIANEDTPGFQANVVTFESSLAGALEHGGEASASDVPEGLPSASNGNNVDLSAEMSLLSQTNLENQSVVNSLDSQFSTLSSAITG